MKRRDLVKSLKKAGYEEDHGGNHDIFFKGTKKIPVPRHREISEPLAKVILRQAGLK